MRPFVVIGLIIIVVLWVGGSFDKALAPLGLNWGECATNGFGATYCGDELDEYRRRVADPINEWQREVEAEERSYGGYYK